MTIETTLMCDSCKKTRVLTSGADVLPDGWREVQPGKHLCPEEIALLVADKTKEEKKDALDEVLDTETKRQADIDLAIAETDRLRAEKRAKESANQEKEKGKWDA